ncbi:ZnF3 [Colletotrichum truncatum]|uniref:ZnF3 n=1 Tax=Colletotrichum truncatum TaxID=5467 RepID=A0ACC3ZCZ2_COLTU
MRPLSACTACRDRRKKCDRSRPGVSCNFCIKRGIECIAVADVGASPTYMPKQSYEPLATRPDEGRPRQISCLIVPEAALCEELVELYFRYAHIAFHNLFHRPTFIARVKDSSIPKILFFGVASLSARYSTHRIFASIKPWDRGRPYRDETKRLLELEDTSLTSIQACMLLAANASVEGDPKTESVYHAIAFRMAMLLDLPNIPTESLLEQEINRRVWWSLITTETWTSAAHTLPRLLKPRDTVPLPMDERRFVTLDYDVPAASMDQNSPVASPSDDISQSLVAQMIRLNILLYDIILLNARVVAEHVQDGSKHEMTTKLAHALEDWATNLSSKLQYSDENVAYWVEEEFGAMFITLHINYNHAGQLLFYQHLHSAQDTEQGPCIASEARSFAKKCKEHATNLCDLIYRAKQRPETIVLYPLAGHILCLASTVQIHTLLFGVDDNEIQAAKTRLERNFEMISSMNNYWPMNHKSIGRLQLFHNTCLRSKDDSFRLDVWMLRFLLGFTQDIEDRDASWSHGQGSAREFDHLRNLLDI